jgi:hypothetical protein
MRPALSILVCIAWLAGSGAGQATAQTQSEPTPPAISSTSGSPQTVDGIAARIEDDVLTESEVRELGAYQQVVDGSAKPRIERIQELADQWIVRGEAEAALYSPPSAAEVDRAYAQLVAQFPSPEEFKKRCAAAGLSEAAAHRMLGQQLYLARFLDFRFRSAAQVDQKQVEDYYNGEFSGQMKAHGQPVPPLDDVEDAIREVLIQREINDRATQWLDETRERLKIDVMSNGDPP